MSDWQPPRCSHGHILLGCPDIQCPEQNAYLADQEEQMLHWQRRQMEAAREVVREALGMPQEA